MTKVPFLAVEGPIGIGKTSLAKKIASHFEFHLLKEIVSENPFLDKFYEDINEWSFQTEMFFLCNRYKQLEDIDKDYLKHGHPVVADYHMAKNMIFAKRTLDEGQFDKYRQIYEILTKDMPQPNLVIYITGSLDTIMERIRKRGRKIEKNIESEYLQQLSLDYKQFMNEFEKENPDIPLIRINGDEMDFMQNQDHLEKILNMVNEQLTIKGASK